MEKEHQPKRQATQFDGKKALIKGDHPYADKVATCVGVETTLVGPGLVFRDKNDQEFFIFKPVNIQWL